MGVRGRAGWVVAVLFMVACSLAGGSRSVRAASAPTVVTFAFDEGHASQYVVRSDLAARGMHATFFVNSAELGTPGNLSVSQLQGLAADGNEVGGQSLDHADLTQLTRAEQVHEICDDRAALLDLGFDVRNFAYPYGAATPELEQIAFECGYDSARKIGGAGASARPAESLTPPDLYSLRTPGSVQETTTVADLEQQVTNAEQSGGGWLFITIHDVCDGCTQYSVSRANFDSLLDWLAARSGQGTVVRTVQDVLGRTQQPRVQSDASGNPDLLRDPSLESDTNADGIPDCFQTRGNGTNTYSFTRIGPGHSGADAEQLTVSALKSGDRKLLSSLDQGHCAPKAAPGNVYRLTAWYRSDSPVHLLAYWRDGGGVWHFLEASNPIPAATAWTAAGWTTPPLPAGATAVSVGAGLVTTGTASFDDFNLTENMLHDPSLDDDLDGNGKPDCTHPGGSGSSQGFSFTRVTTAHTGPFAEQLTIDQISYGDRKFVSSQVESGDACAPAATPNTSYRVSSFYISDQPITLFAYYYDGGWFFLGKSPPLPPSATWAEGGWTTPPVPASATTLSVGPGFSAVGTAIFDDLGSPPTRKACRQTEDKRPAFAGLL